MAINLSTVSLLFGSSSTSTSGINTSLLTGGTSSTGGIAASAGSIKVALANADKNAAKQTAQVAKDPQVVGDLARYEKVLKSAKSIDDVLKDPVARKVLMTANGLKADVDNIGLLKKALLSDPTDTSSVAYRMSSINGGWIDFAKKYDLATYGLDALYPQQNGMQGRWKVTIERDGEPTDAMLQISQKHGVYSADIDGVAVPISVNGSEITLDTLWRDDEDGLHTTRLIGTLGKDGLSGAQYDDGVKIAEAWSAEPFFKDSLQDVKDGYIAEKRLDMLDQQMPGLGSAVLFKQNAKNFKNAIDILGSPLAREVVTTAFNIPKQIAVQSLNAQEKAITKRMDISKLQNANYADIIAQRYLIVLNGGLGGITA